jgi:hypothetical protein
MNRNLAGEATAYNDIYIIEKASWDSRRNGKLPHPQWFESRDCASHATHA